MSLHHHWKIYWVIQDNYSQRRWNPCIQFPILNTSYRKEILWAVLWPLLWQGWHDAVEVRRHYELNGILSYLRYQWVGTTKYQTIISAHIWKDIKCHIQITPKKRAYKAYMPLGNNGTVVIKKNWFLSAKTLIQPFNSWSSQML